MRTASFSRMERRLPRSDRTSPEFRTEAASIRADTARLTRRLSQLLGDVYAQGHWSAENLLVAKRFITDGNQHVDAWLALAPPPEMADVWQKLLSLLEDFGPLLDEVHSLTGAPPASVRPLVAAFRSRFRQ